MHTRPDNPITTAHTTAATLLSAGKRRRNRMLAFLSTWNAGNSSADIIADGDVNTLDVLEFLNLWNVGC